MSNSRGRGRGGNGPPDNMLNASDVRRQSAQVIFSNENRERANEQALHADPDLRARMETTDQDSTEYCDLEDQLWISSAEILRTEFNALSISSKEHYEQVADEYLANEYRRLRNEGRLIENEASLAQKAEDDRAMAAGAPKDNFSGFGIGTGRGRGGGGGADGAVSVAAEVHANACSYGRREIIPPFDLALKILKVGVIRKEEYF